MKNKSNKHKVNKIEIKKKYGQHFLREQFFIDQMLDQVNINKDFSIFEIGCGDGFLTKSILEEEFKRFWVFEIDSSWAEYVQKKYADDRMQIFEEDILKVDFSIFEEFKPWILLSNLPYQITFPLFYKLIEYRHILKEAVVMLQEEVVQKIVKKSGRGYGFSSLFLQHFFEFKLLSKVPPSAFYPPPKIYSRLLYFKPRLNLDKIKNEKEFWKFIKACFSQPRRNLKNNLKSYHYNLEKISDSVLNKRAQQLSKKDFLEIWDLVVN